MNDDQLSINGQFVLLRGAESGVHFGTLVAWNGRIAKLKDARNLWEWEGANCLNEVAEDGITKGKVSKAASFTILTDVVQIMFPTAKARKTLEESQW